MSDDLKNEDSNEDSLEIVARVREVLRYLGAGQGLCDLLHNTIRKERKQHEKHLDIEEANCCYKDGCQHGHN